MTDEAYNGANLTILSGDDGARARTPSWAERSRSFGDVASVKAAVDTQGKGPFADQANPKAALDATDSSHLGFMYVDMAALFDWSSRRPRPADRRCAPGLGLSSSVLRGLLPDWEGVALRVEGDAVVLEGALDRPDSAVGPSDNRTSSLTEPRPGRRAGRRRRPRRRRHADRHARPVPLGTVHEVADRRHRPGGRRSWAAWTAPIGWIGDAGYVVDPGRRGDRGRAPRSCPPTGRGRPDFTSLRTLLVARWLAGRRSPSATSRTPGPRSPRSTSATSAASLGQAGLQPGQLGPGAALPTGHVELAYAITDRSS